MLASKDKKKDLHEKFLNNEKRVYTYCINLIFQIYIEKNPSLIHLYIYIHLKLSTQTSIRSTNEITTTWLSVVLIVNEQYKVHFFNFISLRILIENINIAYLEEKNQIWNHHSHRFSRPCWLNHCYFWQSFAWRRVVTFWSIRTAISSRKLPNMALP